MNTKSRVLAIGIDGPTNDLFEDWIEQGLLPNLKKLKEQSQFGHVVHDKLHSNQNSWLPFLTGISIEKLDYWLSNYNPGNYHNHNNCLYNLHDYPPFYSLDDVKVVMFDLPVAISEQVNGVQVVGWASELNETYSDSRPEELISKIEDIYGTDPKQEGAIAFYNDREGRYGKSYRVPSAYDLKELNVFKEKIVQSTQTRRRICEDLMNQYDWDLFITAFSEIHVAGHTLWHMSQEHPIQGLREQLDSDLLFEVYQSVDVEIGKLVESCQDDTTVVFYTIDSVVSDGLENPRSVFLPELLYRWSFPGKAALAPGVAGDEVPEPGLNFLEHWKHEVWKLRTSEGDAELQSPLEQEGLNDTFSWQPTNWYKPLWPKMKAFALPSVADGSIRLNVKGREQGGIIEIEHYDAVCDEITQMLEQVIDARTGKKIVSNVLRVKQDPFENDTKQSPADLIVLFREELPSDTVDSPTLGRIGPIPFFRPGGHQKQGSTIKNCFMIRTAESENRLVSSHGQLEDIPATIAALLGKSLQTEPMVNHYLGNL